MKKMTCRELGGACDFEFQAETFEEMAEHSKMHGMEMFQQGDAAHVEVITKMMALMNDPAAMTKMMEEKRALFDAAPLL